jgi:Predicted transcriptional regulator
MSGTDTARRRTVAFVTATADGTDETVAVTTADELCGLLTAQTVELLQTSARKQLTSIRDAARLVGRDIKTVHYEPIRLGRRDLVAFADNGRARRPVVVYDKLVVEITLTADGDSATTADV